jgi:hypothetical protein
VFARFRREGKRLVLDTRLRQPQILAKPIFGQVLADYTISTSCAVSGVITHDSEHNDDLPLKNIGRAHG